MNTVTFTHSIFNTDVVLFADAVYGAVYAPTQKSTVVIASGGASVPVLGTVEEAIRTIAAARAAAKPPQEDIVTNGISKRKSGNNKRSRKADRA